MAEKGGDLELQKCEKWADDARQPAMSWEGNNLASLLLLCR